MTDGQRMTVAALTGAAVGVAATAALLGLGLLGRNHAAVSATIVLTPAIGANAANCRAQTLPATILVGKKDVVNWTVTGQCDGVGDVNLVFFNNCGVSKTSEADVDDLFEEGGNPTGRKFKRKIKRNDAFCYSYIVRSGNIVLEDPELEIMQF
jgi:hypothetical protein